MLIYILCKRWRTHVYLFIIHVFFFNYLLVNKLNLLKKIKKYIIKSEIKKEKLNYRFF